MTRVAAMLAVLPALALAAPAAGQDHSTHHGAAQIPPVKKREQKPAPAADHSAHTPPAATAASDHAMDHGAMGHGAVKAKDQHPTPQANNGGIDHSAMPGMNHGAMDHGSMPGMNHEAMDHGAMPGMNHGAMDHGTMPAMQKSGTALPAGDAPAPPVPHDHYADRDFPAADMARARAMMMKEGGGGTFGQLMLNLFEYQTHEGRDGYRWDGEAWYGGDIHRLWFKSEGEGAVGRSADSAEVQILYSRAVDPYFNLQAGVRQDLGKDPRRTYATIGVEGLAPRFFEVEGAVFLSDKGDVSARFEGYHDMRLTQRLVLQPRAELNLAAQDVPEAGIGAGLTDVELGVRLRYEISRRFAPYIGLSHQRSVGKTARLSRSGGEDPRATSFVAGLRFWF